jgi:hypothetical protein
MPIRGSPTLSDVAAKTDMLAVACSRCERAVRYPLATLIDPGRKSRWHIGASATAHAVAALHQ